MKIPEKINITRYLVGGELKEWKGDTSEVYSSIKNDNNLPTYLGSIPCLDEDAAISAIEQADIAWRRQSNTINTAARNAANQQNVMNAFNLEMSELQFLWQEVRDNAAYTRQAYENDQTRRTQLYATAIGNEAAASGEKNSTTTSAIVGIVERALGLNLGG